MKWYLKVLNQYADFKGRARRKEYWMFTLFNIIFAILCMGLDNLIGMTFSDLPYGFIYVLYILIVFIPGLAVAVRRLHDIGKSGWYYFIGLIPIAGPIVLLVWFCQDSQLGTNKWGENPKGIN